jgi:hypothetical protein
VGESALVTQGLWQRRTHPGDFPEWAWRACHIRGFAVVHR